MPTGHYSECNIDIEAGTGYNQFQTSIGLGHFTPAATRPKCRRRALGLTLKLAMGMVCASTPPETHVLDVCRNEADTNVERILNLV
jgi:hypothetical protein